MENWSRGNTCVVWIICIVRVCLKTWKRTSVRSRIEHSLISRWVKPWRRSLVHADVNWVKGLPRLDLCRKIRMHKLLLLNLSCFLELTARRNLFAVRLLWAAGDLPFRVFDHLRSNVSSAICLTQPYLSHDSEPSGESCILVTACENPLVRRTEALH